MMLDDYKRELFFAAVKYYVMEMGTGTGLDMCDIFNNMDFDYLDFIDRLCNFVLENLSEV